MKTQSTTGVRRRKPARAWDMVRTCNPGEAFQPLEARLMLAFSAKVNFQPATAPAVTGYGIDGGHAYGARAGTGLTYGWNSDNRANAFDRNSKLSPSQLHDTLIRMQNKGSHTWQIAVPNGTYDVLLSAGDATTFSGTSYRLNVENVQVINGIPTSSNRWLSGTARVVVSDGRLTVSNGPGAKNNNVNFIEIAAAPPAAPTLASASVVSATQANITWTDNADNEEGFAIERSADGGVTFTPIGTVGADVNSYLAGGLDAASTYIFRVRAFHSLAMSGWSNDAIIFTPLPTPTNFSASAATSSLRVKLAWADVVGEDGYRVLRSTDGTTWSLVRDARANTTTYEEFAPAPSTSYTYRVVAYRNGLPELDSLAGSATVTTPDFRLFDTLHLSDKPDLSSHGLEGMLLAYEWTPDPLTRLLTEDKSAAVEDNIKRLAAQAYAAGQPLVFDLESWPVDTRFSPKEEVKAALRRMVQMVQWSREGRPELQVGFYNTVGPTLNLSDTQRMQQASDVWRGIDPDNGSYDATHDLVRNVSFLTPSIYPRDHAPERWWRLESIKLAEARRVGAARQIGPTSLPEVPVYPFMSPNVWGGDNLQSEVAGDFWKMQLAAVRELADGAILWDATAAWDDSEEWWLSTQSFAQQPVAAVAAPSNLAVDRVGTYLTWQDNSNNESGFVIERSTSGGAFQEVAMVPADDVTWKDDFINTGVSYTYRVLATSGLQRSAASAGATVVAARDGFARIEAATYDDSTPGVGYGWGVLLNEGIWFKYSEVHFGSGVNQFAAQVEVPFQDEGQIIEVRIGSVSGPLVGMIDLAPSAGWGDSVLQTNISQVSGIHDVYLVVKGGDPDVVSGMTWVKFSYNAPPAPPAKPISTASVNTVGLEWLDYSGDESGFELQRAADGGEFVTIATLGANATHRANYTDTGLNAFASYSYRVRSFNQHGYSDWSAVQHAGYAEMADLQNLALNKFARQSSTEYGGTADKAVDGNTDGIYDNGSVTHTAGGDEALWWEVDLGAVEDVEGIEIWNRVEAAARLSGFYIFVSDTPFASDDLEATRAQADVSAYYIPGQGGYPTKVAVDRTARYVRIQLVSGDYLSLAEVKVFG